MTTANAHGMKELEVTDETSTADVELYLFQFECLCTGNGLDLNNAKDAAEAGSVLLSMVGTKALNLLIPQVKDFDALKALNLKAISDLLKQLGKAALRTTDEAIVDKLLLCESTPAKMRKKLLDSNTTLKSITVWQREKLVEKESLEKFEPKTVLNRVYDNNKRRNSESSVGSKVVNPCRNCGFEYDAQHKDRCPAKNAVCRGCQETGHFERKCRSKDQGRGQSQRPPPPARKPADGGYRGRGFKVRPVREVEDSFTTVEEDKETNGKISVLSSVNAIRASPARQMIDIANNKVMMLFDTGADLDIAIWKIVQTWKIVPKLKPTTVKLTAFASRVPLIPIGEFMAITTINGVSQMVTYIVVDGGDLELDNLMSLETLKRFDVDLNQIFNVCALGSNLTNTFYFDQKAFDTFIREKYKVLFRPQVGRRKDVAIEIELDPAVNPIRVPKQNVPVCMEKAVILKLRKWLSDGVITLVPPGTKLRWLSSLNPVEKKPGVVKDRELTEKEVRITVNFKNTLNKALISSDYAFNVNTLTTAANLKRDLAGSQIYSTADILDFYSSIPLAEESKILTAFTSPIGICMFECVPQGLTIASQACQEVNTHTFGYINDMKNAVDDFLIYGKPSEEHKGKSTEFRSAVTNHNATLVEFLDQCVKQEITLNEKCEFGVAEAKFFGYTIKAEGIKPTEDKMRAFKESRAPKNCSEVHSFLGKATHFADRIIGLASIRAPLQPLVQKGAKFKWEAEEQRAFERIKETIIESTLEHFCPSRQTKLYVDGGPKGVSTVLVQIVNKKERIVACGSHALNSSQINYSQIDKEMYSAVWGMGHFQEQLLNCPFTLVTDNKSVKDLLDRAHDTRRQTRKRLASWRSNISEFKYTVQLCKSEENIADFLSRCHSSRQCPNYDMNTIYRLATHQPHRESIPTEEIIAAYQLDQFTRELIEFKRSKKRPSLNNPYNGILKEIGISTEGLLTRNDLIIIPQALQQRVVDLAHRGHGGMEKMKNFIRRHCYFPLVAKMVTETVKHCAGCRANSGSTTVQPIKPTVLPEEEWSLVAIDFTSKLPSNEYILVAIDEYSRYPICHITKGLTSAQTIAVLRKIFAELGVPNTIKSDNGPAFKSKEFKAFATEMGFTHQKSIPVHPPSNGNVERFMTNINKTIRCSLVMNENWKLQLDAFIRNYRASVHSSTLCTPNELMNLPDEIDLPSLHRNPKPSKELVRYNDEVAKERMREHANKYQHAKESTMNIGDQVLNKWIKKEKFQSRFDHRPYEITEKKGTMVTATRPDHQVTRDMSSFKQLAVKSDCMRYEIPVLDICMQFNPFFRRRHRETVTEEATPAVQSNTPPPTPNLTQSNAELESQIRALEANQTRLDEHLAVLRRESQNRLRLEEERTMRREEERKNELRQKEREDFVAAEVAKEELAEQQHRVKQAESDEPKEKQQQVTSPGRTAENSVPNGPVKSPKVSMAMRKLMQLAKEGDKTGQLAKDLDKMMQNETASPKDTQGKD